MSQAQLAARLPMSLATLQGWERAQPRGMPPPYIERALNDLARELSLGSRGAKADMFIREDMQHALEGTHERSDSPFPPASSWTDEHAGGGYPPQSTDTGSDEPTHELAYVQGDEMP